MSTVEYIVLIVIAILAALFIVRTIMKLAKGESPCMFCKSCGDEDEKKSSCCASEEDKTQEYDFKEENEKVSKEE